MATIASIMTTNTVRVQPETSVSEALALLVKHHISGLPVVDAKEKIVGILSEKDLLSVFSASKPGAKVADFMTRKPQSFSVDAELVDVVDCLMANDFRRVLIHKDGKLVGLISRSDLMPVILEALQDRTVG